jgi:hypothetical protein
MCVRTCESQCMHMPQCAHIRKSLANNFLKIKSCFNFYVQKLNRYLLVMCHKACCTGLFSFLNILQIQCLKKNGGIVLLYSLPKYCLLSSIFVLPSLSCHLFVKTDAGYFSALIISKCDLINNYMNF